ncbi:MAG: type I-E CRISPR-associated endonuclease Cas1e [Candidatus Lokiarchaeota archaeon]
MCVIKKDLRELPKIRDSLSYLYIEHSKIEQDKFAIAIYNKKGKIPIPCASLSLLMLGPGTSITHAAIKVLSENGCLVSWCGENSIRFYAQGLGETRNSRYLIRQAYLVSHPKLRLKVVRKLYQKRFKEVLGKNLSIRQIRGKEGARVKNAYKELSEETGVTWNGRNYNLNEWNSSDTINKAISAANACLYGICHAAINSIGCTPGLGFIHIGKQLSFVYDIADLYKFETSMPIAFQETAKGSENIARRVRIGCRDAFFKIKLLKKVIPDIQDVLSIKDDYLTELNKYQISELNVDELKGIPGGLWDPENGAIKGGKNFEEDY